MSYRDQEAHSRRVAEYLQGLADGDLESLGESTQPTLGEIGESIGATEEQLIALDETSEKLRHGRFDELTRSETDVTEALIIPDKRPVIDLVTGNTFRRPSSRRWRFLYEDQEIRKRIEAAAAAVGRVELEGDASLAPYLGTGFMVGPNLLLTNRHVADDFVRGVGDRIRFTPGVQPKVDMESWIVPSDGFFLKVNRALIVHPHWDAAILEVEGFTGTSLKLLAEAPRGLERRQVAIIGYPAFDRRNAVSTQYEVFRGTFEVKRLQPGLIMQGRAPIRSFGHTVEAVSHDSSTLGGNSGSAVVDLETGHVVGLHFGGIYLKANYAVPGWELVADPKVRQTGLQFEGSPQRPGSWVQVWRDVDSIERPEEPAETADASAPVGIASERLMSPGIWFENTPIREIIRAYERRPEAVGRLIKQALGEAEGTELIAEIEGDDGVTSEIAFIGDVESTEEGVPPRFRRGTRRREPDPDLPEIIYLHGIIGGHVAHQGWRRNRIWLDPWEMVKGDLAEKLTLAPDGRSSLRELRMEADGHIELIYRKAANRWRMKGFVVHPFSYDWRRGIGEAAQLLDLFIEQRFAINGGRPLVLVGHSMGGVICSAYGARYPHWSDRIERAILIGAPLGGSYSVPQAVTGHNPMLNKVAMLARKDDAMEFRQMAATFPGLLDMMPDPALFPDAAPLFQEASWGDVRPKQRWLTQAANWKKVFRDSPLLDRATMLVNLTHSTVVSWSAAENAPLDRGIGDGSVPATSALVDGVPAYKIDYEHGTLTRDPKAINAVVELITENRTDLDAVTEEDLTRPLEEGVLESAHQAEGWSGVLKEGVIRSADGSEAYVDDELELRRRRFKSGQLGLEDLEWFGSL